MPVHARTLLIAAAAIYLAVSSYCDFKRAIGYPGSCPADCTR